MVSGGTGHLQHVVGDLVVVSSYKKNTAQVYNLRMGIKHQYHISVNGFFPVPYDGKCACSKGECRCIYESYDEFKVRPPDCSVLIPANH